MNGNESTVINALERHSQERQEVSKVSSIRRQNQLEESISIEPGCEASVDQAE